MALAITGAISVAVFAIPDLVSIGLVFLIIPGLILGVTPTIFFYLAAFSVPWFTLSRRNVAMAIGSGCALLWLLGFQLPSLLNRVTDARLREAEAREKPIASGVNLAGVIALQRTGKGAPESCGDLCQTLLYDAKAERVVLLAPKGDASRPVTSFRTERVATCPDMDAKTLANDWRNHWLAEPDSSQVQAATRLRIAGGECLVQEPWSGSPSWTIVRVEEDFGSKPGYLSPLPGEVRAEGLQLMAQGQVVARRTRLQPRSFAIPLYLHPRSGSELHMLGWEWGRTGDKQKSVDSREFLAGLVTPSRAPDVTPAKPRDLRQAIDNALNDPNAGSASFGIVDDYYTLLRPVGANSERARSEDARRMARLIADPRVTAFWFLPLSSIAMESDQLLLRDPILDRMGQFAEQQKWDNYRALASLAGRLPEGAFREPDARVDAIVGDPDLRRAAPALVTRLADRGPSAAPALAGIATEGWGQPRTKYRVAPGNQGDDPRAALAGLYQLGRDAGAVLPALRQGAASGSIPAGIQETELWRATLVALGASASEFNLPKNQTWQVERYRASLEEQARQHCRGRR